MISSNSVLLVNTFKFPGQSLAEHAAHVHLHGVADVFLLLGLGAYDNVVSEFSFC